MEKSKIFDIVKSGQNLVLLEQLLQGIMKDQFKGFSPNDFFEKEYGIIPKRESKEYDIDNAISHAIIYEIDSFVTPLLMLWGQLNLDCNNESFYLAKPLSSDHDQRSWVSTILLNHLSKL